MAQEAKPLDVEGEVISVHEAEWSFTIAVKGLSEVKPTQTRARSDGAGEVPAAYLLTNLVWKGEDAVHDIYWVRVSKGAEEFSGN